MRKLTKFVSVAAAAAIAAGVNVTSFAAFSDMPAGEMGSALQRAVDVGLMNGVTDTEIAPNENITRAQMATILVRAFGAEDYENPNATPAAFNDVAADAWYKKMVEKASLIGAFQGDDDNNFNPENNITFQETYTVLSRMFGFEPYEAKYSDGRIELVSDCDESVLNAYPDAADADGWAKNYVKYIVGNGGWTGIGGQLKPKAYITRGEFAMLMDKIVANYVDESKEYTAADLKDGHTLVRAPGATIKGFETNGNVIVTYGVGETGATIAESTVNGVTLILGGADSTPKANSKGKLMPDESHVHITGTYKDVRNSTPFVYVDAAGAKMGYYKGVDNSLVSVALTQ